MAQKTRIGINGFGRIGRTLARNIVHRDDVELVAINDIAEDVENLVYLYNYDSTYGRASKPATISADKTAIEIAGKKIMVFCNRKVQEISWDDAEVDILIDSSGVADNIKGCHELVNKNIINRAVITHSPKQNIDKYIIMGVNDDEYNYNSHKVVSSSICDANAISHPLKAIDDAFGIEFGYVTTLHPWLSYQNLVDAPMAAQSNPGHFWKDYSLGRSSINALIPKDTTAVKALEPIIPDVAKKLEAISYRIPTNIVCSADITLRLQKNVTLDQVKNCLENLFKKSHFVRGNYESLVSVDYIKEDVSSVVDMQWLKVSNGNMVKIVVWYDNEWGYSARAVDLAAKIGSYIKNDD